MARARASLAVFALTAAAGVALVGVPARADEPLRWPAVESDRGAADSIALIRWEAIGAWTAPQSQTAEQALHRVEARLRTAPEAPSLLEQRAVALRSLGRFDDARAALARAPARLSDPDAVLTRAYLAARDGHTAEAVALARTVLPTIGGTLVMRAELVTEIARWAMADGLPGLPSAIALLREMAELGAPDPMVRATLATALARAGRADEARAVALGGSLPSPYAATLVLRRGALQPGEADAAVGHALLLANRPQDAIAPLARAAEQPSGPWRGAVTEALADARAHAAGAGQRPVQRPPVPARRPGLRFELY